MPKSGSEDLLPQSGDTLPELAAFLHGHRSAIAAEWMSRVRADPAIQGADSLTRKQLEDHVPVLISDLIEQLRAPTAVGEPRVGETKAAEAHGATRWEQGYRLDELILETGRIRDVLLEFLARFALESTGMDGETKRGAVRIVCRFFDEVSAASARQFAAEQQERLAENARQIEQALHEVQSGSEKLRAVSESRLRLLRTVSHELRNALNSVQLAAQSLLAENEEAERGRVIGVLFRSVGDLHQLLDRLMDFSSMLAGGGLLKIESIDLREFISEMRERFLPTAELRGLHFEVRTAGAPPSVASDRLRLQQIVTNLVSNAFKYTERGKVRVEFTDGPAGRWRILVEDTGMGIAAEDREQIFQEFHRSPRTADIRGTGLGLAITHHLVSLLGGTISVQSEPDQGSRFEVMLPFDGPRAAPDFPVRNAGLE